LRPTLVVTDIRMPGTGGADVISELVGMYPGIPVIAISAHFRTNHGLTPIEARVLGAARTLAKPFRRKEMVDSVVDLIGPPPA
jgi:FixJ family two-component response regulator